MMAASAKPRAFVFGHSFVRRFGEFASQIVFIVGICSFFICVREVEIFGTGGRTVDKTIRFNLDAIRSSAPDIVVLDMGSYDACEQDSGAETIASSLVALTELLISECKLQFIVVCHILPRKHPPFEEYNDRVRQINALVSEGLLHFLLNAPSLGAIVASFILRQKYIWRMVYISKKAVTELFTRVIEEPFSSPCLNRGNISLFTSIF